MHTYGTMYKAACHIQGPITALAKGPCQTNAVRAAAAPIAWVLRKVLTRTCRERWVASGVKLVAERRDRARPLSLNGHLCEILYLREYDKPLGFDAGLRSVLRNDCLRRA